LEDTQHGGDFLSVADFLRMTGMLAWPKNAHKADEAFYGSFAAGTNSGQLIKEIAAGSTGSDFLNRFNPPV
jgi:hypothetical protein